MTLLTVSHELTRSGSSTGSSIFFDCGIYQSLVDACDRRILTLILGSTELESDDTDDDDGAANRLCLLGTSICRGACLGMSTVGGRGFLNRRTRSRIAR